ncbi:MAG: PPOX class F420-dependent oxidoreductase [Humibacillus sp.]|nr:PPOX class F420-dependent oxidoreductase [Humibacillus sp.]MDN5779869.1 PPOX class F420-dependent oxidoreductase [Humibacillus sp.]
MTDSPDLLALGDVPFIRLTTFRRSGEPVGTTVWVARDGESLVVFTPVGAGKLKRLRHTRRVEVAPSSRRGTVADHARTVEAVAEVDPSAATLAHVSSLLSKKYGFQYKLVMLVEKVFSRGSRDRDVIRITAA